MKTQQKTYHLAAALLRETGMSVLDAVRLVKNSLDFKPSGSKLSDAQFCAKVIQRGLDCMHMKEMSMEQGFELYLLTKEHLRPDSLRDIKYLGRRLLRAKPELARGLFSELSVSDCEQWLGDTFSTPSQFNKAHTMLHGLMQYALRQEWVDRNPIKSVAKKRVVEREIVALSLQDSARLPQAAQAYEGCAAAVGLLLWAGVRPKELRRLHWRDLDLRERSINISSSTSKTGGTRQIDMCSTLKSWLQRHRPNSPDAQNAPICPPKWRQLWEKIRHEAGFKDRWVQDVLRHTYASYHARHHRDLPALQLNMGHRDCRLLAYRYVNMRGITRSQAKQFFRMTAAQC